MNYWEEVFSGCQHYYTDADNPTRKIIADYIKPEDTVLDLGCGEGTLKSLIPNKYTGFDYAPTAIKRAKENFPESEFILGDARDLSSFKDNQFDVVVMRHFLENQEDWRKVTQEAFRICNKKVIIVARRITENNTELVEQVDDTWVWDINYGEINMVLRQMTVNVSYGKIDNEDIIIAGKHMDDVVFELDDFYDDNNNLDILVNLKKKFPKLKVTLFCIPSKCSVDFINKLKERHDWMQFAVHGWFHDTNGLIAQECNFWTEEEANKYLDMAEEMGCFEKIFRAPGWNMNIETYKVLIERGYIIAEHLSHDRWAEMGGKRYTTGHLWEVHGHVQNVNMNGLEELATTKCNFGDNTEFHFITEDILDNHLPNKYQ